MNGSSPHSPVGMQDLLAVQDVAFRTLLSVTLLGALGCGHRRWPALPVVGAGFLLGSFGTFQQKPTLENRIYQNLLFKISLF